jgi:4-alpha-glucanotransferase
MDEELLNRLADAAGIEPNYWDIQGRLHQRSTQTARQLLHTLGVLAETDAQAAASLAQLTEEAWREVLPPVIVATEGRDIDIPIHLAADTSAQSRRWSIDLEGGGQVCGEIDLQVLPIEATAEIDGVRLVERRLQLPAQPLGYHRLRLEEAEEVAASLIVAPAQCYLPPGYPAKRYWGVAAQLYGIRSQKNWGIGDFGDLNTLGNWAASHGADTIGINPLHALFLDVPQDMSPYSPSSRLFLNPLYLDVTVIPDFSESVEARALAESSAACGTIRSARQSNLVDYLAVAAAKLAVLEQLYQHFSTQHAGETDARNRAFREFTNKKNSDLRHFATFQMLSEHFGTHAWMHWPVAYRDPATNEVALLAQSNEHRISFFEYLQWQCELQVSFAAERMHASGMTIGLYNDLAVGVDAASADHWANQRTFVQDARVGAPPDPFNEKGQEWGLVPLNPRRLRASGYAHFISLLRASMRHAGALRIDHVMGWQHLYCVPVGNTPSEGAYVRFPLDDLLSIAALESHRNRCVVIGEDLGTVPDGFRERMANANVLSCRILYFEVEHDRFRRPAELPRLAAVSAATHDLATLHGYWLADDITAKTELGIITTIDDEQQARIDRARDKRLLLQALADEGLLPHGIDVADSEQIAWTPQLANAVHAYLARSQCLLLIVQLDDLTDERQQANLPGSTTEFPNWRRRLNRSLEELIADTDLKAAMTMIADERNR